MSENITHSGMDFLGAGAFHIEKSPQYSALRGKGIKSVEFIRPKGRKLFFVEAKSSFPNPDGCAPNPDKGNKTGGELFEDEIDDVCQKFVHSLNLYAAIATGAAKGGLPPEFAPPDRFSVVFALVIARHAARWCRPTEKAIISKIREASAFQKIWTPEVAVMNHEKAKACGLAVPG